MKIINYTSSQGNECAYGYVAIPPDILPGGSPGIVLVHVKGNLYCMHDNMQAIINPFLKKELVGYAPEEFRFFTFYSPYFKPFMAWQEVTFSGAVGHYKDRSLWELAMRRWRQARPDYWSVSSHQWHVVGHLLKMQLDELINEPISEWALLAA
jgi:hypothetical protein